MSWYEQGGSSQPPQEPPSGAPSQPPPSPPPPPAAQPPPPPPDGGQAGYAYSQQYQAAPSGPVDDLGRPLAAWWKRLLAIILDIVIVAVPIGIITAIFGLSAIEVDSVTDDVTIDGGALGLSTLLGLVVTLLYFGILDGGASGKTVGKMALNIQVRDATSPGPIGVGRAIVRRLVYQVLWYVFFIPGLLNALSPLWDRKRQAWHDKVANSVVIDTSR